MNDRKDSVDHKLDHFDELLKELPVSSPSRDLVAAALEETQTGNRSMAWWITRVAAAAAAVFVLVVGLPREQESIEAPPSDAEIAARLSKNSGRSAKFRSRIHIATYGEESSSLSDRIKRARQKSRASKQRIKREGKGHV